MLCTVCTNKLCDLLSWPSFRVGSGSGSGQIISDQHHYLWDICLQSMKCVREESVFRGVCMLVSKYKYVVCVCEVCVFLGVCMFSWCLGIRI
jgi:hypothetical protein